MVRAISAVALVLLIGMSGSVVGQNAGASAEAALADFPFWQKMSGWWEGDNTYMDSDLNYLIRSYSSLVRIELKGGHFREVEHRFYPEGLGASRYGKGLEKPGEGIELVVTTTGELIDGDGTVGMIRADHLEGSAAPHNRYRLLSDNDAVRLKPNLKTGVDTYRMYFTFVTADRRLRSNVAIHSEGEDIGGLRAFILYRDQRIDSSAFDARRAALREKHKVKLLSVADPDKPGQSRVTRLD
jgi:hypothetical protein